ncbi:hypothetical protein Xph01_06590 [Micromonospora phaseoli]|nr:hypothetical protein Xph01_06590 [Micromonospora phaseoli]
MVGAWRGSGASELIIAGDRTFSAKGLPSSLVGSQATTSTVPGVGRWSIQADVNDSSEKKTQLVLVFEDLDDVPVPFSVKLASDLADGKLVLFWTVGDPDLGHRVTLEKV